MRDRVEDEKRRRIVLDCAIDGERVDLDLPLESGPEEGPEPEDVDLAYLRSVTRDLVSIGQRFAPDDGAAHVVDLLAVHYKSAKVGQRITWHVTYVDALRVPHTIVTDADTAAGAFYAVFWHHCQVASPIRVAGVDQFCHVMDGLIPVLAQPLPNFARDVAQGMSEVVRLAMQISGAAEQMSDGARSVPRVEAVREPRPVPLLRAVGGGRD